MSNLHDIYPDDRIILREVGLRDGLQLVKTFPSTAAKRKWIAREYDAGVRHFEVGSFLSAKTFPQFADVIGRCNIAELSATLDRLNICFSPINRPEDLFDDPHVLREGGLVGATNADGAAFRVPALPVEWNGASIGDGLKVPVLGADTASVLSELEPAAKRAAGNA